jgi:CO dehydrogenase nickel-insertion accessory protein CooC1
MKEVGIEFENYYLIGGYRFPQELENEALKQSFEFLGRIEFDERVERFNFKGKSLLELPTDSPAYEAVRKIMIKAGYDRKSLSLSELLKTE